MTDNEDIWHITINENKYYSGRVLIAQAHWFIYKKKFKEAATVLHALNTSDIKNYIKEEQKFLDENPHLPMLLGWDTSDEMPTEYKVKGH